MNSTPVYNEPPPPTQATEESPRFSVFIVFSVPGLVTVGPGAQILADMLLKILSAPLRHKGLLSQEPPSNTNGYQAKDRATVAAWITKAYGLFQVNHLNHGLSAIKEELASFDALPYAKIGWMDRDGKWKGLWPHESKEPFEENYASFLAECDKLKRKPE